MAEESTFTDQTPQIATEEDCRLRWAGGRPGARFRCYLCGHKFQPGDRWRFVFATEPLKGCPNFMVCDGCDGDDVEERFKEHVARYRRMMRKEYWWARRLRL